MWCLAAAIAAAVASGSPKPSILLMFPDELRAPPPTHAHPTPCRQRRRGSLSSTTALLHPHRRCLPGYDWGGLHANPYYTPEQLPLRLPHVDALAQRGVRFTRAHVASPVCAPSRACLASGREYDPAGQGGNGASVAPTRDGDFDVEEMSTFYQQLQRQGYWTMVTGRDDLTKRTGPGLRGDFHTAELGFNDSARCGGSVDVTWGECGGADNGAAPCAGIYSGESESKATVHEPYGAWLEKQPIADPAVRAKYSELATAATGNRTSVTNYFELDFWRYAELTSRGAYDSVHW